MGVSHPDRACAPPCARIRARVRLRARLERACVRVRVCALLIRACVRALPLGGGVRWCAVVCGGGCWVLALGGGGWLIPFSLCLRLSRRWAVWWYGVALYLFFSGRWLRGAVLASFAVGVSYLYSYLYSFFVSSLLSSLFPPLSRLSYLLV